MRADHRLTISKDPCEVTSLRIKRTSLHGFKAVLMLLMAVNVAKAADEPPTEWIEPSTGHRVIRLSREPGSSSFYFHQNGYTAEGDKLLVSTPDGLSAIDLKTHKIDGVVAGRASNVVVGKKTRQAFYTRNGAVYATHLDTQATRETARL